METYHRLIPKKAIKAIEKFQDDLAAFALETGEEFPILYEDANTMIQVKNLLFTYEGTLHWTDEDDHECWEAYITEDEDGEERWDACCEWDSGLRYWRGCLRRAKRYWSMDTEKLDAIQDGLIEDDEQ